MIDQYPINNPLNNVSKSMEYEVYFYKMFFHNPFQNFNLKIYIFLTEFTYSLFLLKFKLSINITI